MTSTARAFTVSTDATQITLTLKMTSAQVVETSVNVISNSPSQNYTHPDDRILLNYDELCIYCKRHLSKIRTIICSSFFVVRLLLSVVAF